MKRNAEYSSVVNTRSLDERFCSQCPLMDFGTQTTHLVGDDTIINTAIELKCVHYDDCCRMLKYVVDNDWACIRFLEMVLEERKNRQ